MCINMTDFPVLAMVGSISGSRRPAETSLMMSAPAAQASSATRARYVSMLMAMWAASGMVVRMCLMAGITRDSSSDSLTGVDPGRVLSPPMSIMVAPERIMLCTVVVRVLRSVGECVPPSEKESGVRLRMAIMWVGRDGLVLWIAGKRGDMGVVGWGVGDGGGRVLRWLR